MKVIAKLPTRKIDSPHLTDGQRLRLYNVRWESYLAIGQAFQDRAGLHLTYNQGTLEFMTLSFEHERCKYLLGRLVDTLAEELDISLGGVGSTTFQREDLERGLEPDQCYYLENLPRVRGKKRIDLDVDPPPDLVLEVDITRSSKERLVIYASMGVPEVWRFDGETLQVLLLSPAKDYQPADHSQSFPTVPISSLVGFLEQGNKGDDLKMVRAFRTWIKEELLQPKSKGKKRKPRKKGK